MRRNAIILFMCVELMLNAVNLTFVAFAQLYGVGGPGLRLLRHDGGRRRGGGRTRDHHRDLPPPADGRISRTSTCCKADAASGSDVDAARIRSSGTVAEWVWLVPLLPLARLPHQRRAVARRGVRTWAGRSERAARRRCARRRTAHDEHGAHGDDHHAVARHRYAGIASIVGPACSSLAFALAVAIFMALRGRRRAMQRRSSQRYFSWMPAGDLQIDAAFQLDQLSMVMMLVVTGVGTLIHLFSVGYMQDDPGYARYFAYLNLFVFFMLRAGARRELPGAVHRLGRRRALLLPADRLLVQRQGERRRRQEGVHRQPHRRLRLPGRDVPAVREPRARSTSPA